MILKKVKIQVIKEILKNYRRNLQRLFFLEKQILFWIEKLKKCFKKTKIEERDIIGLDEETNRVLYFNSQEDVEDEIELKTSILQKWALFFFYHKHEGCFS